MFGRLLPASCHLSSTDSVQWRRLMCGTCHRLGAEHGLTSRALLTHDGVMLAALVDGLTPMAPALCAGRCPLQPWRYRSGVAPSAAAIVLASNVQVVLAQQWMVDHTLDGEWWASLGQAWVRRWANVASRSLHLLGLRWSNVGTLAESQFRLEATAPGPIEAAEPTAHTLGSLCAQIADLPGVSAPDAASALATLGRSLGNIVYLLDAIEDIEADLASGAYNPCLTPDRRKVSPERWNEAIEGLRTSLEEARKALRALPLVRNFALLDGVLRVSLPARLVRAQRAGAHLVAGEPARSAPMRAWHGLVYGLRRGWASLTASGGDIDPKAPRRKRHDNEGVDATDAAYCCEFVHCGGCGGDHADHGPCCDDLPCGDHCDCACDCS